MSLRFTKMHGLGNDFIVIDATRAPFTLTAEQIRALADRHFGVGFDQLLVVEPPPQADVDFGYRIFNADGSEVEQCGNGARCFARFVHDHGLTDKREIRVATRAGVIAPRLEEDGLVTVDMGVPEFAPERVPFAADEAAVVHALDLPDGARIAITALSMGNPHAVQVVTDVANAPVATHGPLIEQHPRFPARVNAGFMEVVDAGHSRLRVFERGSGETLACGSGACAAVVAGVMRGLLTSPVRVATRGGELRIHWDGEGQPVRMTGPATSVFEGTLDPAALTSRPTSLLTGA